MQNVCGEGEPVRSVADYDASASDDGLGQPGLADCVRRWQRPHITSQYLNNWPPAVATPWTPSARADGLAHFAAPVVERLVVFAVRQSANNAVVAPLAPGVPITWCLGVTRTIAKSSQDFLLAPQGAVQPLTSHSRSKPEGDEALAGEFRVVVWGQGIVVVLSHSILLGSAKSSHAHSRTRAMEA